MGRPINDLTGYKIGKITVVSFAHGGNEAYWNCICECGKTCIRSSQKVKVSLGCPDCAQLLKIERHHPLRKFKRERNIWLKMLDRCTNPRYEFWKHYGGRGITVCSHWLKFENFLEDLGECPIGYSIERIDVNQGYYKENCCWISKSDQQRNTRRNVKLTVDGETKILQDWASISGLDPGVISYRLRKGMTHKEAVFTPNKFVHRFNRQVSIYGVTKSLKEWGIFFQIPYETIRGRLRAGLCPEAAVLAGTKKKGPIDLGLFEFT